MIQIRQNVFETNSSSTHSLAIMTKSDFEKWKAGELVYDARIVGPKHEDRMLTREAAAQRIEARSGRAIDEDDLRDSGFFAFNEYLDYLRGEADYLDIVEFKTPHEETVVIIDNYCD